MSLAAKDKIQKQPGEIEVGDLVWDGFDGFEVAEVIHSTDGTIPVVEMRSATGDSWRVRGEGGTTIAVVKDKESLIERSSWDPFDEGPVDDDDDFGDFEDDEEFDDEEDED